MRIMINEPDGRLSGIVMGEAVGINYDSYFKFKELDGKTGKETVPMLQEALDGISADEADDYERLIREKLSSILRGLLDAAEKNPEGKWQVS